MAEYRAPLADLQFALNDVADLAAVSGSNGATPELVDQVLDEAGRFASEVLAPLNRSGDLSGARIENGVVRVPDGFAEAYGRFVDGGWNAVCGPTTWGGQGLPWVVSTALNEIWQSANMSLANCMMLTQGAVELLSHHGTEAQKRTYLPKLISGEWSGTMNLTEPHAGSDLGRLQTRAEEANGAWRLRGQKIFITFGDHDMCDNIVHLVLGRLPDAPPGVRGISLFLVSKRDILEDGSLGAHNDVRVNSLEHKLGQMGSPTCVLMYGDDEGARAELVGEPHGGLKTMFTMMNHARLNVGIQGVAIAERAYQQAVEYARARVQGSPIEQPRAAAVEIIRHPDVRRMIMDMKAKTEAARALAIVTAEALDRARAHPDAEVQERSALRAEILVPIMKGWGTDQGVDVASTALQVHGGMGYIEETGAAQHYRDARILPHLRGHQRDPGAGYAAPEAAARGRSAVPGTDIRHQGCCRGPGREPGRGIAGDRPAPSASRHGSGRGRSVARGDVQGRPLCGRRGRDPVPDAARFHGRRLDHGARRPAGSQADRWR